MSIDSVGRRRPAKIDPDVTVLRLSYAGGKFVRVDDLKSNIQSWESAAINHGGRPRAKRSVTIKRMIRIW
jgi:hypothetical protein